MQLTLELAANVWSNHALATVNNDRE